MTDIGFSSKIRLDKDDAALVIRSGGQVEVFSGRTEQKDRQGDMPFPVVAMAYLVAWMDEQKFMKIAKARFDAGGEDAQG